MWCIYLPKCNFSRLLSSKCFYEVNVTLCEIVSKLFSMLETLTESDYMRCN